MPQDAKARALVESAYGWLRLSAGRFAQRYGRPPAEDLFAEGVLVLMKLASRYDEGRGATFATYCAPHVYKRWRGMRDEGRAELPAGGWLEVLGLMRVEGTPMEGDGQHLRRVDEAADLFVTASIMSADVLDEQLDAARLFRLIDELPEPQKSLLNGLYRQGKTLTELTLELGLRRGRARSQVFIGMRTLSRQVCDRFEEGSS